MNKLKLYYHLSATPHWEEFFDKKKSLMESVGLWQAFDQIVLCTHYDESAFANLKESSKADSRIRIVYTNNSVKPFSEQYTNRFLKQEEDASTENSFIFRVHNKGLNHYLHPVNWPPNKIIAEELDYQNINRWQECVAKLAEGYEAVGAWWVKQPWPHFKGNIWWTTSDYIKKLKLLPAPHEVGFRQQITGGGWTVHDAESWIGTASPRAWDILRNTDQIGNHPDIN